MHNLTNYHSHCNYCDGKAPLEDFIKSAIEKRFTSYGISSHAPLPFPTKWTMNKEDVSAYLAEANMLKEKYASQIELYIGMEIDYLNEESNPSIPFFRELPLDYRIGSVHLLEDANGTVVDTDTTKEKFKERLDKHFNGDLKSTVLCYFRNLMHMIELGGFDIVGHADKISYNADYCEPGVLEQMWYKDIIREYFSLIAKRGLMVEINTKAYKNLGVFYPNRALFPLLKELHIPVMVNSDAHFPELINDARPEALLALQEAGIHTVMELHHGQWKEVPIA